MADINVTDYDTTINPAWYWLYNYQTQCWDKAETGLDGIITVYQWSKEEKIWVYKRQFTNISYTLHHTPSENDYAYWYAQKSSYQSDPINKTEYDIPNSENDNSLLGQVWKWNGSGWIKIDNQGAGKIDQNRETYVIVHGLRNSYNEQWISSMAAALASKGQVLCIDWGDKAKHDDFKPYDGDYNASNIDNAAARAAILLSQVLGTYRDSYSEKNVIGGTKVSLGGFESNINLVGHSFGAHLSAYFSKYVTGTIKSIHGLDSAEEDTQANPIILDSDSASSVFFYKTSDILGGGDTWVQQDSLLGGINVYVVPQYYELSAEEGLSTLYVDKDKHSYAYDFFRRYMSGSYSSTSHNQILSDLKDSGCKWHGIVNASSMQMDCVNVGYMLADNYLTENSSWTYKDYDATVSRIVGKMNTTFASVKDLIDMPAEIYAVACMTALDVQDLSINGTSVSESLDVNAPAAARMETNKLFSVNFAVKNYADNVSFNRNDVISAQKMQNMTHEVWLSISETLDVNNKSSSICLYSSLYDSNDSELFSVEANATDYVSANVAIDHVTLLKWINSSSELSIQFKNNASVDLYMHVRVGVDANNRATYIPGELQSNDNSVVQKVSVKFNEGIWTWCYNSRSKCWDKVTQLENGSYIAYQWNSSEQDWTNVKFLRLSNVSDKSESVDSDTYNYYYEDIDVNKDGSQPGQIWLWENGNWVKISEKEIREKSCSDTYVITHGLRNTLRDTSTEWMDGIASALSQKDKDARILAIDWGDWSMEAMGGIGDVFAMGIVPGAERSATMLSQLIGNYSSSGKVNTSSLGKVHLIGHSYGAHYSAYLASKFVNRPVSLVGLDSAEELFQMHDVILGPQSAENVYFYKSSLGLGGGDAGDKPLGKFNFYTVGKNGQITMKIGNDDTWEGGFVDNHGYAYSFYQKSIKDAGINGEAGYGIEGTDYYRELSSIAGIISQKNNYNDYYIGVVGANNRIECVSKAYYEPKYGTTTPAWTVLDYWTRIQSVRSNTQSGFPSGIEGFVKNEIDVSDNIEAVAYLVDYIAPESVSINSISSSGDLPLHVNIGDDYTIEFSVYNYADNHAFSADTIKNAQKNQHSTCRVWLSTSNEGLDFSKSVLINSTGNLFGLFGNTDNSLSVLPESSSKISFDIEVTKEHIQKLGITNNGEYYLYVQVGINSKTGNYIAGELASHDNATEAIPIEVKNEGTATTFVVDISGSMSGEINSVKAALKNYINSGYTTGKMMKLITFWDDPGTQKLAKATKDPEEMLEAINGLRVTGGISPGEISLHALETAINETSRDGQIILITDEVPHTGGNPKSLSYLTSKANKKGVKIYTSFTGSFSSLSSSVYSSNGGSTYALRAATVADEDAGMDSISSESATADDTYTTATVVTADHNVTGSVHYSEDRYDWYKITLSKNYTYSFNLQSETYNAFMTLYYSDGVSEVGTIESGEGTTLYPNTNTTYYLRVRAHDYQDTPYTLSIKQTCVPAANTMEAYSILATETGGAFQALPKVNSSNSAVYESAIYNFLVSQDSPVVLTCGPNELYRGTTATLTVTGSGTNWRAGQTTVTFSSDDITVTNVEVVSATSLQVTVQVEGDCTLDSYDITVQSGTETAEGKDVVTVGAQPSSRKIVSVSSTSFECGKEFIATIHGYNTNWSQEATQLSMGPGVSISGYEVVSATEIRVAGVVDEDADLGYRTVNVKTSGSTLSLSHALFVTSATPESPVITTVTPSAVIVGKEAEITIVGKNLDFMTSSVSVDMGYGVEVREVTKVDSTTLKVKVMATLDSAEGFRDVLVSVDGQPVTAINGLDVQPDIVAPEVTLNTPVVEKVSNGRIRVTLSWSCTEESTYVLDIDGTEYTVEGNTYSLELADGFHTYSVQASDYSGNKGVATGNFAMDATALDPRLEKGKVWDKSDLDEEGRKRWFGLYDVYRKFRKEFKPDATGELDKDEFEENAQAFHAWYMKEKLPELKRADVAAAKDWYALQVVTRLRAKVYAGADGGTEYAGYGHDVQVAREVLREMPPVRLGADELVAASVASQNQDAARSMKFRQNAREDYERLRGLKQVFAENSDKAKKERESKAKAEERKAEKAAREAEKKAEREAARRLFVARSTPREAVWVWDGKNAGDGAMPQCRVPEDEYKRLQEELGFDGSQLVYVQVNGARVLVTGVSRSGKLELNAPAVAKVQKKPNARKGERWKTSGNLGFSYYFKSTEAK